MRSGPQRRRLRRCATLLANLPSALRICGHWTSTRRLHTKPPCVGTGTPTWRPSDALCELVGTRPCGFVEVRPDGGHHYCAHTGLFRVACGSERLCPDKCRGDGHLRQVRGEGACVVVGSSLLWFCTGGCVLLGEGAVTSEISIYPGPHGPHWRR